MRRFSICNPQFFSRPQCPCPSAYRARDTTLKRDVALKVLPALLKK
jgi:hypothetical protein